MGFEWEKHGKIFRAMECLFILISDYMTVCIHKITTESSLNVYKFKKSFTVMEIKDRMKSTTKLHNCIKIYYITSLMYMYTHKYSVEYSLKNCSDMGLSQ